MKAKTTGSVLLYMKFLHKTVTLDDSFFTVQHISIEKTTWLHDESFSSVNFDHQFIVSMDFI